MTLVCIVALFVLMIYPHVYRTIYYELGHLDELKYMVRSKLRAQSPILLSAEDSIFDLQTTAFDLLGENVIQNQWR